MRCIATKQEYNEGIIASLCSFNWLGVQMLQDQNYSCCQTKFSTKKIKLKKIESDMKQVLPQLMLN